MRYSRWSFDIILEGSLDTSYGERDDSIPQVIPPRESKFYVSSYINGTYWNWSKLQQTMLESCEKI